MEFITPAEETVADVSKMAGEPLPRGYNFWEKVVAYVDLTKPRITLMVVFSSLAGFALGSSSPIDRVQLFHLAFGIAMLSSGISTLNQYWERSTDALMDRTKDRPLPSGRLMPHHALLFGVAVAVISEFYLAWFVNPLTAVCGSIALASYLFLYTPLKTRSRWCTFIGAFPGAMPPLLGWAAARNEIGVEALVLFAILFFWQFPHFHAIAVLYRAEYGRAGIRMLPVVDPDGRSTVRQIIGATIALILTSLLPTYLNFSGWWYFAGAAILGGAFFLIGLIAARSLTHERSSLLLKASVLYLPLLLGLMVFNS
jgi:heme o synthase